MLILQEGAGVYSPDCRDLSVELKGWKDAPCFAVSREPYRPAEVKEAVQEFMFVPGLTAITCQTIAQLSFRYYNLLCFDFLSFPLNHVVSSPSCYEVLFQLSIFLYSFDKYFREEWARRALNWNISCKGLLESQSLLNNNKHSSGVAFLTDLFSAPVSSYS